MTVSYIRERNAFYNWLTLNHLSPTAQALWNALFTIYNGQGWPDGWIEAPDMLLRSYMHVSNDALLDARQQLKNKGLLDFVKGNRRVSAAKYRMIWLSAQEETEGNEDGCQQSVHNDGYCQEKTGKGADKQAGKAAAKEADKQADKGAAKGAALDSILDGVRIPRVNLPLGEGVNILQQGIKGACEADCLTLTERQKGYAAWYREFDENDLRNDQFAYLLANRKYTFPQLSCALTLTQGKYERGKVSNPLEYIKALLNDWNKRGLTEREDIEHDLSVDLVPTGYYGCKDWDEAHGEGEPLSM